jgi:ABC-2 type transport system permease protein
VRALPLLRFLAALVGANWKAAWSMRAAFWTQVLFMLGNDLIWFGVWAVVFARFPEIGGWRLEDMAVLQGVLAASFGLSVTLLYGVRDLAHAIDQGDLDAVLVQPKPPLLHALASRTSVSGFGDVVYGVLLIALSGRVGLADAPVVLVALVCGAISFTAASTIFHASAFWLGPVQPLAASMREFLILFSGYPETLFVGGLRGFLFTVMPAAFAAWMPAELVRRFTWSGLAWAVGGAVSLSLAASFVFHLGLRRYVSGSRFTIRA